MLFRLETAGLDERAVAVLQKEMGAWGPTVLQDSLRKVNQNRSICSGSLKKHPFPRPVALARGLTEIKTNRKGAVKMKD